MVKLADWLAGFSENGEINRFKHTQLKKYHFFSMLTALAALAWLLGARCLAACLFRSILLSFLVSSEALTTAVAVRRGWKGKGGGGTGKTYSSCKRMRPDTRSGLPRMLAPVQPQQPPHARVCSGTLTQKKLREKVTRMRSEGEMMWKRDDMTWTEVMRWNPDAMWEFTLKGTRPTTARETRKKLEPSKTAVKPRKRA